MYSDKDVYRQTPYFTGALGIYNTALALYLFQMNCTAPECPNSCHIDSRVSFLK